MWIDRVSCGAMTALAYNIRIYKASFFVLAAVSILVPRPVTMHQTYESVLDHRSMDHIRMILPLLLICITNRIGQGWWAIFREIKWAFILFGGLHLFLLTLWPAMFASTIYRYVFVTWSFFACVSVTSYLLVIATTIMAIICRLNFGKGLGHFCMYTLPLFTSPNGLTMFDNSEGGG